MKIEIRKVSEIKPYPKNAKKHNRNQIEQVAESIKRFGWVQPIVVDEFDEIVIGHCRFESAKLLKQEEVPTVKIDNLSEAEIKALRLADNKLNESAWDIDLVIEDLKLIEDDELKKITGLDLDIIKDLEEDDFDAQKEYEKIVEPQTKTGDLYQLGNHKLYCGNSTDLNSFRLLMGEEQAQMVFTDPPYNVNYDYTVTYNQGRIRKGDGFETFSDKKEPEEFKDFIKKVFTNAFNFSKDNASFYCWHASKTARQFEDGIKEAGWYISQTIFWLKNNCTFTRGLDYLWIVEPCFFGWKPKQKHYVDKKVDEKFENIIVLDTLGFEEMIDVMYERRDKIQDYIHPTQKPIRLAERALKKHSQEGDIVLETFNGSGSTMMACQGLGRKCYAIELDPKFIDVAITRWCKATGNDKIIKNGQEVEWKIPLEKGIEGVQAA